MQRETEGREMRGREREPETQKKKSRRDGDRDREKEDELYGLCLEVIESFSPKLCKMCLSV